MMKIAVLGTGYVGLVAGTCFAENGNDVTCIDVNSEKIDCLNRGEVPIFEPGLAELVGRNVKEGRLHFTTDEVVAIRTCDIIFIAVGTPSSTDGSADLEMFLKAAESIGKNMNKPKIIVNKSTVPVGTAAKVRAIIKTKTPLEFDVVSNPEFLKEGSAIDDFLYPDRVVIGCEKEETYKTMAELYAPFVRSGNPVIKMSNVSAEMTKYAANSFLATKISFINEIARLCELVGADVESVRKGITSDPRIGRHFLYAGAGYGGSCFPKDVKALVKTAKDFDMHMDIVSSAQKVNETQKAYLFTKIEKTFGKNLSGRTFALWGLAFKPNTDDMREAPALVMIDKLVHAGATIRAYDPVAMPEARKQMSKYAVEKTAVTFVDKPFPALEGADALIIMTEWSEFRNPDFDKIKSLLLTPIIFDGRNVYDPKVMKELGFTYIGIGR